MKVKAIITGLPILQNVAQSIEKLGKRCVLRMDQDSVQFIVAENMEGCQVWATISAGDVFEDFVISSNNQNVVALEMSTDHLVRTFKSVKDKPDISMRLAKKKDLPYLIFTIQSRGPLTFGLTQDVPVEVLSADAILKIREPPVKLADMDAHILFPPLSVMRTVVDRMKALSGFITVAANLRGELELRVRTELSEVTTSFKNLSNPEVSAAADPEGAGADADADADADGAPRPALNSASRDPAQFAEARVDAKNLGRFLQSHQVNPAHTVCCIIEDSALIFYLYTDSKTAGNSCMMIYYIPAVVR